MSPWSIILSILSMIIGAMATIAMLGIMLLGAANMPPEPLAAHYRMMWLIGLGGLMTLIISIVLLYLAYPGWSAIVAGLPFAFMIVALVWALVS